ncbi:uncharacterized protein LOC134206680 [Armigeres subalbatus]|uniref:uncharacterized protein LOC134206680 n=1 Tax=Armigeres subalbatus TaxID=124917 RepID=UPI002ED4A466
MASSNHRRSLVRMLTDEESGFDCTLCTQPNIADKWMVQCDACGSWIHFSCAGVDERVKNDTFICAKCIAPPPPPRSRSSRSTSSSVRAARQELELKRLAEEKALHERLLKEQQEEEEALHKKALEQEQERRKKAMKEKLELERQFIEKKFEILQAGLDEDDDDRSMRSHRSVRSIRSTVQSWVEQQGSNTTVTGKETERVLAGPALYTGAIPKRTSATSRDETISSSINIGAATCKPPILASTTSPRPDLDLSALQFSPPTSKQQEPLSSVNMFISPPPVCNQPVDNNSNCPQLFEDGQQVERHRPFNCTVSANKHILLASNKTPASGTSVSTLAFLDDGSSYTLVEQGLADELGITGQVEPLCLQWTSGVTRTEVDSRLVQMEISGGNSDRTHIMDEVRTVEKLDLPPQSLRYPELAQKYEYLKGLPIASYESAVPRILIGVDNTHLLVTLKKKEGKKLEPVAAKTRLGWTIYGNVDEFEGSPHRHLHICDRSSDDDLHDKVKEFFLVESVGVAVSPQLEAEDDRRAREIMENTTTRTASGKFQTGLLWRFDYFEFPDSRSMAIHRFKCLERRLSKNPDLYDNVRQLILDYQNKGYAHKLTKEESMDSDPRRVWYLPLGIVLNPNKPGKLRVIWDAAAKVENISLNSMLMKGPDLTTSLITVLQRFRQRQFAIAADIKEMFHQIEIRPQDRQAQRFLWRNEPSEPFEEFVMDVATFGSTCSPSSAQYIKNKNAYEWRNRFPEAAVAIVENHYVDDYLDSLDSEDEAIKIALDVKNVHARAGFEIRNWLSNSERVIRRVGDPSQQITKNFSVGKDQHAERILGMKWTPQEDIFTFALNFRGDIQPFIDGTSIPTKRQVLRVVMSIFDPLGLAAVFVIHGKCLIQEIWRASIGWDDLIPEELRETWRRWLQALHQLPELKFPRCYFSNYSPESLKSLQLHIFVDASEAAYSCVAYFRIVDRGHIRCVLVSARTKVAPLKPMSIPRLELQAAVIGTRLMKSIQQSHTLTIDRRTIWSDSRTVLSWIQSDQRKYRQFVAFRVGEILEETKLDEWRWVPTRLNVADEATKWGNGPNLREDSRWFRGPEFLYLEESQWPTHGLPAADTGEEQRGVHAHHRNATETVIDFERFSNLQRLIRTVGYVRRFAAVLRKTFVAEIAASPVLSRQELQEAEFTLWRWIQAEAYFGELLILVKNRELQPHQRKKFDKASPLRKLSLFIDNVGVIRLDGRLRNAPHASYATKFPVVLPKNHYGTRLLVLWYHQRFAHGNSQTVINEIRQKFHIASLRVVVRIIAKQCKWCAVYKAIPRFPKMAPLPEARVTPYVRAFTFIGIDYCGPFSLRVRRYEVKKWIMLVTCLTVRAVHLEVVGSLSTEACKMAIRRFIARRGAPQEIYSDQGTNFIGASRELRDQIASINREISGTFTNADTQWHFNPPATPHMGGAWERLVRSVKTALRTISSERKPDEETFYTYLTEVESIINSRPLTYVPLEYEDTEALTPNHFLLLSSSGVVQPAQLPVDSGVAVRSNWDQIQHLLDLFWTKWIKEYMPVISCRSKWLLETEPVKPGDLVMIVDPGTRNSWKRGRIVRIHKGKDGVVRRADVQTNNGMLQRSVTGLAVLEVMNRCTAAENVEQYGSGHVGETDHPSNTDDCQLTDKIQLTADRPRPIGAPLPGRRFIGRPASRPADAPSLVRHSFRPTLHRSSGIPPCRRFIPPTAFHHFAVSRSPGQPSIVLSPLQSFITLYQNRE